jgi:cell division protein FtsN
MKNIIKVLLYVLLALLVVAIAMVIYKKSNNRSDVVEGTTEQVDSLFLDAAAQSGPLSPEDSMILDLTGELPSQTGVLENVNSTIDYSQPIPSQSKAVENTSPKAQAIANKEGTASREIKKESETSSSKSVPKEEKVETKKSSTSKPSDKATSSPTTKSTKAKTYYVIAGSFIVPSHADKQVVKLKKLGFKSSNRKVFGDSEYYSVVAGKFSTRSEADKTIKALKAKGMNSFVKEQ